MLKISDNPTHCAVSKIVTYLLTGGKKAKSYKHLHHWLDAGAARYGWRHRKIGIRHNILIAPVVGVITRDPLASVQTVVHLLEDNISTSIKRKRRNRRKR